MCLLDSLLGGRRRAPEDDEPRPWISRRHLLGFYPIFRIEGAADHLDPEDWISEPSLSKWRSPRGSDRISKDLSVEGIGTDVVPRDVLSSATLINALDPRGDSRAGARPPTFSAVFRPICGSRVPPTLRSRGLDSGYLWKRNTAVQPTHTTPISRYRQHMSTIVKHLFRSGSKKSSASHRNP